MMDYLLNYINSIDPALRTLPEMVYIIWQTMLWSTLLVVVPLVIFLLQRTLNAALYIRRYFTEMLAAGVAIAENTGSIAALSETITVSDGMLKSASDLDEHSAAIAEVLATRARGNQS